MSDLAVPVHGCPLVLLDALLALRALDKGTVEKAKSLLLPIAAILSAVILKKEQV